MNPELRAFLLELARLAIEAGVSEEDPREGALRKLASLRVSGGATGPPPDPSGFGFSA